MRSSGSPGPPFAEQICTFSRATYRPASRAASSATKGWVSAKLRERASPRSKPGDRVLISCITACGRCDFCREGMYSHCTTGGRILGNSIDGTQAEFVRIPYADTSLYRISEGSRRGSARHAERSNDPLEAPRHTTCGGKPNIPQRLHQESRRAFEVPDERKDK